MVGSIDIREIHFKKFIDYWYDVVAPIVAFGSAAFYMEAVKQPSEVIL